MLTFARGKSYNRKSAKIAQHPVSIKTCTRADSETN